MANDKTKSTRQRAQDLEENKTKRTRLREQDQEKQG